MSTRDDERAPGVPSSVVDVETAPMDVPIIDEHADVMKIVLMAARILAQADVRGAIDRADRALSVGPVLDPTLWREKNTHLEQDIRILRSALPLWTRARELAGKVTP